jgi:hypothetical protein
VPDEVLTLKAVLALHGFRCIRSIVGDSLNSEELFASAGGFVVRVTKDRGQVFVDAGRDGWGTFFDADCWRACLNISDRDSIEGALDSVGWFARNAVHLDGSDVAVSCLKRYQRSRAYRALGLEELGEEA